MMSHSLNRVCDSYATCATSAANEQLLPGLTSDEQFDHVRLVSSRIAAPALASHAEVRS